MLVCWLKRDCPWIITKQDLQPHIEKRGLDSFLEHGWDAELGWIRKPGTSRHEDGRAGVKTSYTIDQYGARRNPGYENEPIDILAYGDSYTFCRQVNDDETWPHFLSGSLDCNVANFGVGNFGLDQALLRLEREFSRHPTKIVLMGVVPETISRVHAFWKHFSEYGNTLAFKPRFILKDGHLELIPNAIDTPDKFLHIPMFIEHMKLHDYFYQHKFRRDILFFPFSLTLIRSWKRNSRLLLNALTDRLKITREAAFSGVMERNINIAAGLFRKPKPADLFLAICDRFKQFCLEHDAQPVLVVIPQLMDLKRIQQGEHYYKDNLEQLGAGLTVVDLAEPLSAGGPLEDLYINDRYGGHLSSFGNRIVEKKLRPICQRLLQQD